MALNSYDNLKISIADWLARKDLEKYIPDFIRIAESRLNNNPDFRVRKMVCKVTADISGGDVGLPDTYLGMRELRFADTGASLQMVSPQTLSDRKQCGSSNYVFCDLGQRLEVFPVVDGVGVELFFYQMIPALSDTNQSNWLLVQSPDTYLYGSLMAASMHMKNDERVQLWGQMYADAVQGIVTADKRDRWSGGNKTVSVA